MPGVIVISCQSKAYTTETNIPIVHFDTIRKFPNNTTAFEKINNQVVFYTPSGNEIFTVDLKSTQYEFYVPEVEMAHYLVKVNDFIYFLPQKVTEHYVFSKNSTHTVKADVTKVFTTNNLGLITSITYELPEDDGVRKHTTLFTYNLFAQLLKITDNGKILLENKYDDQGNVVRSKTKDRQSDYQYDSSGKIIKKREETDGIQKIFTYTYNAAGWLEKKYTEDQNEVEEFRYQTKGNIREIVRYSAVTDKSDAQKLMSHFTKKTYIYSNNLISEEKEYEYNIMNASVLINKKWNPLTIDEQRKLAWKTFNDQSGWPISASESKYKYQPAQVDIIKTQYSFANRGKNDTTEQGKEVTDINHTLFTLDSSGRAIKETVSRNKTIETKDFSY